MLGASDLYDVRKAAADRVEELVLVDDNGELVIT
jgi:hypothetical protein